MVVRHEFKQIYWQKTCELEINLQYVILIGSVFKLYRYKRHSDGKLRLQTVRYESMELTTSEDSQSTSLSSVSDTNNTVEAENKHYEDMPTLVDPNHVVNMNDVCVISVFPTSDKKESMDADSEETEDHEANDGMGEDIEELDMDVDSIEDDEDESNTNNNAADSESVSKHVKNLIKKAIAEKKSFKRKQKGASGSEVKQTRSKGKSKKFMAEISENIEPIEDCVEIHITQNDEGEYILERKGESSVSVTLPNDIQEEETMYNLQMLGDVALQEQVNSK